MRARAIPSPACFRTGMSLCKPIRPEPTGSARSRQCSLREHSQPHDASARRRRPKRRSRTCPPGLPLIKAYEFNGTKLIHEAAADFCGQPDLLLLPTGEVMMNGQVVYKPSGTFQNAWRPTITKFPLEQHQSRREVPDLGHAVQWPLAGERVRRRIPGLHQLSAGAHHQ